MKPNRSKVVSYLIFVLTLITLFFVFRWFFKDFNPQDIFKVISELNFIQIVTLFLTALINIWVFQYPYLITSPGLRYLQAFKVRNSSFAISNCVPAGGTIGLGLQYAMLKSFGISNHGISVTVGIASVWNGLISYLMPILGLISLTFSIQPTRGLINSTILGSIFLIFAVVMLILIFKSEGISRKFGKFINKFLNTISRSIKIKADFTQVLLNFRTQVIDTVREKWFQITLSNLIVQFSMFLIFLTSCIFSNVNISIMVMFAAFCFGRFGTVIPFTPGGVGTTDVIMVSTLVLYGSTEAGAITAVLLWRFFYYVPQVALGVLSYFHWQLSQVK